MIIFPAIDLLDGKCVRLKQGLYDQVTKYSDRPEEVARDFKAQGAKWIHIVDLNAAKTGVPTNHEIIGRVVAETGLRIQTGGAFAIWILSSALLKNMVFRDVCWGLLQCVIAHLPKLH